MSNLWYIIKMEVPRKIAVRARKEGYETRIFDSVAVPDRDLRNNREYEDIKVRVDFEAPKNYKPRITDTVLEKIVCRGAKTRLSEKLEKAIYREITGIDDKEIRGLEEDVKPATQWFDGNGAEEKFYREILVPEVIKNGGRVGDILPQVKISSFCNDRKIRKNDERRVDFLISDGTKKLVVELDDVTHNGHKMRDDVRDEILKKNMTEIVRTDGKDFDGVKKAISELYKNFNKCEQKNDKWHEAVRLAHEMQVIIVILLKTGALKAGDRVFFDNKKVEQKIFSLAFADLCELERNICKLYREKEILNTVKYERGGVEICRDFDENNDAKQVLYQEFRFPGKIVNFEEKEKFGAPKFFPTTEVLEYLLNYLFRHEKFRPNQINGIVRALNGKDSIVLLPTGSGKSVIFQLLAMILPGKVLVIEPLKSLMEDQTENLVRNGIDVVINISGEMRGYDRENTLDLILDGSFALMYATPERLQMEGFRKILFVAQKNGVRFDICALDEAHCVSEWGHDFRVAYLNIAGTCRKMFANEGKKPVILALTGTASDNVLNDMMRDLGIEEEGVVRPASFDRPEIHYRVLSTGSDDKLACLNWLINEVIPRDFGVENKNELMKLQGEDTKAGIVFCVYKSGKTDFGVNAVFETLNKLGCPGVVRYYATNDEVDIVKQNAKDFKENKAGLMVATKAFGMGIDKPNIRYTIHFGIPSSIESYYQEAGRAGRDGCKSMSYIILSNDTPERNGEMIKSKRFEDLKTALRKVSRKKQDDVNRLLFLHQRNFDKAQTVRDTDVVLEMMGGLVDKKILLAAPSNLEFDRWQKVLYRMRILEIIQDYAVFSYPNNEFIIDVLKFSPIRIIKAYSGYISKYQEGQVNAEMEKLKGMKFESQREFLVEMMDRLLEFVNGTFESSRRREIGNMLQLAEEVAEAPVEKQDEIMRRKILGHLGNTYQDMLMKFIRDERNIGEVATILKKISVAQAEQILLETRKMLQMYPDNPGLLFLSGFIGASDAETNPIVAAQDIIEGAKSAKEKYRIDNKSIQEILQEGTGIVSYYAVDDKKFVQFFNLLCEEFGERFEQKCKEKLADKYLTTMMMVEMAKWENLLFNRIQEIDLWTKKK